MTSGRPSVISATIVTTASARFKRAEVTHEVLVVRAVGAHPVPPEPGVVVEEGPGCERRPDTELDAHEREHRERDPHDHVTHGSPPSLERPPATLLARSG